MCGQWLFDYSTGKGGFVIKEKIGTISIISEVKQPHVGRHPMCRVCGKPVMPHEVSIIIHKIGEVPSEFHARCAYALAECIIRVSDPSGAWS